MFFSLLFSLFDSQSAVAIYENACSNVNDNFMQISRIYRAALSLRRDINLDFGETSLAVSHDKYFLFLLDMAHDRVHDAAVKPLIIFLHAQSDIAMKSMSGLQIYAKTTARLN